MQTAKTKIRAGVWKRNRFGQKTLYVYTCDAPNWKFYLANVEARRAL